ncbi:MAG: L,D-transpeptidase family protein [Deltaproteobacteria bacterium]|nr:L,D-transpeptidase family protein [Deltaproteobacteria bacterium]
MNETNRGQEKGRQRFSARSGLALGSALCALFAFAPGCNEVVASSTSVEAEASVEDFSERSKPAPAAMSMTRHAEAPTAVATEQVPAPTGHLSSVAVAPVPEVEVEAQPLPADREPIEARTARQRLIVRVAPDHRAPLRARIPMGESFEVFELVEGRKCGGKGWADIGNGGFVCLEKSRKATRAPRTMPVTRGGDPMPFLFAKTRKGESARRWSSMASYRAGDEPRIITAPGRDFAFVGRRQVGGQVMLVDKRGRVMPERDLQRFRPSRFEGHDLAEAPVADSVRLAWTVHWPETKVYASTTVDPDVPRAIHSVLEYHAEIAVQPEPVKAASGTYYALTGGGFVRAGDIRRFEPVLDLEDETLGADEIWIDVELDQQVLTVMQGVTPIYTTLISSGLKGPTPRGLFRINKKQAFGSMSSAPGAADPYAVEAVPYVQYFHGGIALHSAYWHDRFGFRISHGCVNLSPRDAAHVYSLTGPHPRDGWVDVYEDEGDMGTRVRIREGGETVSDRRGPVEHVTG